MLNVVYDTDSRLENSTISNIVDLARLSYRLTATWLNNINNRLDIN